jgi:hypothetical protein
MRKNLDAEAERLTKETGFYHFADFNDLTHRNEIFRTPYRNAEEAFTYRIPEVS